MLNIPIAWPILRSESIGMVDNRKKSGRFLTLFSVFFIESMMFRDFYSFLKVEAGLNGGWAGSSRKDRNKFPKSLSVQ